MGLKLGNNIIGAKFKNICFIGLNRVEYYPEKTTEAIFADTWQDVTDEHSRRHLALMFFSPRNLDGHPVNPYIYLSNANSTSTGSEDDEDEASVAAGQQELGNIPLVDLCRVQRGEPNTVNVLIVADLIFHWDINDSYIMPTTQSTCGRDLKQILMNYPRNATVNVYTNWPAEKFEGLNINRVDVRDMPLQPETWINMPTFQEKYGIYVLGFSILLAGLTYYYLHTQGQQVIALRKQIAAVENQMPQNANLQDIYNNFQQQKLNLLYRDLMPVVFKDIALAIRNSGMQSAQFEISNANPNAPLEHVLAKVVSRPDVYRGWLQEEPIAKALLLHSNTLSALRKPPGNASQLTLEGMVLLDEVRANYQTFIDSLSQPGQEDGAIITPDDPLPEGENTL